MPAPETLDLWQPTFSGRRFRWFDPQPEDIDPRDIAMALGRKPRWSCQTYPTWTVAEHSIEVYRRLAGTEFGPWGLMHDTVETWSPDLPAPLKDRLQVNRVSVGVSLTTFAELEDTILRAVAERFGLPWPVPSEVYAVDLRVRATERRDLFPNHPRDEVWPHVEAEPYPEPLLRNRKTDRNVYGHSAVAQFMAIMDLVFGATVEETAARESLE